MGKRLLATLVCILMVLAMLVGCTNQPAATTAPAATDAPAATTDASATTPAVAEKNEVTINWGANFSADPNNDELGKWIQSNFKIKIVQVAIDSPDKVKMLAASDTLPDLIGQMGIGDATFNQLKTDGMIRDIPDDMLAKYPILKKVIDEQPTLNSYKASLQKNYWLPIYGDADKPFTATRSPYYYRADWAQKLGIAAPTTMDEFYNMLKAFTEQDPDGNGQNDTYGTSGWLWQGAFIAWVDMYSWVKGDDGKWIPGFTSPKMLEALKFYNRLYQEKILDPEFASANSKSLFFQDKIGCFVGNGDYYWIWSNIYQSFAGTQHSGKSYTADEAMAAVQFLPPLKADANTPAQWAPNMDTAGYAFSAKTTDEVLDRILEIANWQLSPDGRDMMTYGFKDKDWMVKDGKAVSILPNNPTTDTQKRLWRRISQRTRAGLSR